MSDESSASDSVLDFIPDEMLGQAVKRGLAGGASNLLALQDVGRTVVSRVFQRNAIFTAKVQERERLNIPQSEVEKLDLEKGELVQVILTPLNEDTTEDDQ